MNTDFSQEEKTVIKKLAARYRDICGEPVQESRRQAWSALNSLKHRRPLIYVRAFAWHEMPESRPECENPFTRNLEDWLKSRIFWHSLNDDSIFEPYFIVRAVYRCCGWGWQIMRSVSDEPRGSFKVDYPIKDLSKIEAFRMPFHAIDEEETSSRLEMTRELLDGELPCVVDRGPAYRMWTGDISTDLGYLRGIENLMLDMMDQPEELHRLCSLLSQGILKTHEEAEAAGDWSLIDHQNQAMPYAEELARPQPDVSAKRKDLWGYMASQEFTLVSPEQFDEFLLQYQLPILKHFGLTAYGCCEDLTRKIDKLRQIPNLRRIAVSPFANVRSCAEQIGRDYVMSYRPNPADLLGPDCLELCGKNIRRDFGFLKESFFDITLKDIETVEYDPHRIRNWVETVRKIVEETF